MTSYEEEIQRLEDIVKILDRGDEAIPTDAFPEQKVVLINQEIE